MSEFPPHSKCTLGLLVGIVHRRYTCNRFYCWFFLFWVAILLFIPEIKGGREYWSPLFTGCVSEVSDNSCFLTLIHMNQLCWEAEVATVTQRISHLGSCRILNLRLWSRSIKFSFFIFVIILCANQGFVENGDLLLSMIFMFLEFCIFLFLVKKQRRDMFQQGLQSHPVRQCLEFSEVLLRGPPD